MIKDCIPEMNAEELEEAYKELTRNLDSAQIEEIEVAGPLSEELNTRHRQEVYRALAAQKHGVVFPSEKGALMHLPA